VKNSSIKIKGMINLKIFKKSVKVFVTSSLEGCQGGMVDAECCNSKFIDDSGIVYSACQWKKE